MDASSSSRLTMTRSEVKRLIDLLPDADLAAAARILRGLLADDGEGRLWTLEDAPEVEPLPDETELLEDARAREARGEVEYLSHEEARRILLGERA